MPATLKRILLLSLALVLSATPVVFAGCAEEMTQEEIDQLVANAIATEYDTVKFEVVTPMTLESVSGSTEGVMTLDSDSVGEVDAVNEAVHMTMNVTYAMVDEGEEDIAVEIYIADGWMYDLTDIAGVGGEWLKAEVSGQTWQQQSPVEQQMELLRTAVSIKALESQTVDGIPCYVLEIEPDMAAVGALLAQETSGIGIMDFGGMDLSDLCEELSVKQWLAQDSYRLMKAEMAMVLKIDTDDVTSEDSDFDSMTVEMTMALTFYDYDQPVSITVPPEALAAEEASYS